MGLFPLLLFEDYTPQFWINNDNNKKCKELNSDFLKVFFKRFKG